MADRPKLAAHRLRLQFLNTSGARVRFLVRGGAAWGEHDGKFARVTGVHAQTETSTGSVPKGYVDVTLEGSGVEMVCVAHMFLQLVDEAGAPHPVEQEGGAEGGAAGDGPPAPRKAAAASALGGRHSRASPGERRARLAVTGKRRGTEPADTHAPGCASAGRARPL